LRAGSIVRVKMDREKFTADLYILASGSPRRKELLESCGVDFDVVTTFCDETIEEPMPPRKLVAVVAQRKLDEALEHFRTVYPDWKGNAVIIAADSVVSIEGKILGKPEDDTDAFLMLRRLSGRWHKVFTGLQIAFICDDEITIKGDVCLTDVRFKNLKDETIKDYILSGEPSDKAGAYGIQGLGNDLVECYDGDLNNVVGLPTDMLLDILVSYDSEQGEEDDVE
jgi:septum formation protein